MKQAKRKYLNLDSHAIPVVRGTERKTRSVHFYAYPSRLDIYVWTQSASAGGIQVGCARLSRKVVTSRSHASTTLRTTVPQGGRGMAPGSAAV